MARAVAGNPERTTVDGGGGMERDNDCAVGAVLVSVVGASELARRNLLL
jgi:hypothetical protein